MGGGHAKCCSQPATQRPLSHGQLIAWQSEFCPPCMLTVDPQAALLAVMWNYFEHAAGQDLIVHCCPH
jgi:hypothetical protein